MEVLGIGAPNCLENSRTCKGYCRFESYRFRQIYVDMSLEEHSSLSPASASGLRVDTKKSTDLTGCQYMEGWWHGA